MNVKISPVVAAAAAAGLAATTAAFAAAPPRYTLQPIEPLATPGSHQGAAARIMAFDSAGTGYGYSLTGLTGAPLVAVRWQDGHVAPMPTPAGAMNSHAAAVSPGGVAVGWFYGNPSNQGGTVWRDGVAEQLGELLPLGINSAGTIAGVVRNPAAPWRHAPAVSQNGTITVLPMDRPDGHGWVVGVSAVGEVAGSWYGGPRDHRAVRWVGGEAEVLPLPAGAIRSEARAMNQAGWIVGSASRGEGAGSTAVLWRGGEALDLGVLDPSTPNAWAQSINSRGQIVGFAATSTGPTAFLWEDGVMHDLRDLLGLEGGAFNAAHLVIGDTGHIAGVQMLPDGSSRGFVLAPVPGPSACALLAGVAAMGLRRRR